MIRRPGIGAGDAAGTRDNATMIAFRKPGVMAQLNGPMIETKRLILRTWRESDIGPNTAMLSDPETARYITADASRSTS